MQREERREEWIEATSLEHECQRGRGKRKRHVLEFEAFKRGENIIYIFKGYVNRGVFSYLLIFPTDHHQENKGANQ